MSIDIQNVCEELVDFAKDKSRVLVGLTKLDEKKVKDVFEAIKLMKQSTNPTEKKPKLQKEGSLRSNSYIIDELKKNLRENIGNGIIEYKPTDISEINEVEGLDVMKNIEDIKKINLKVTNNEVKANTLALYEAFLRGKLYFIIKRKVANDKEFLQYCRESFNISEYTVYNYLNVYYLTEEFQSIVLSGFGVTKLYKYNKLIRKTVEYDNDLYTLLTTPFPGIEATDINIHNLSIDEDSNDMN
jgi:CRISPR/Cas system-associated exonuclease Cas4 (RecB family)